MRIAIDGMLLGGRSSGVEGSIANLARALAAAGNHDYSFYSRVDPTAGAAGPPRFRVIGSRWPVRSRPARILWQQTALPLALARGGFDLLHAPGYVAPLLASKPVVLTLYDTLALSHPGLCTAANRWHYRLLIPASVRRAAAVIVPSEATRRDVVRAMPWAAAKVRVIPLGVEAHFRPDPESGAAARLEADYGLTGPYVLFVGGLEPKKNLARLVEAFGLVRHRCGLSHRLVIAGPHSWDRAGVERAIGATGLGESVLLPGFVPPELLPALYRGAAVFVFPSLYEGFGLPPLEAMACGTPVIVSDRGALPETAGPAALVVDPLRAEALAGAMEAVLTRPDVRADLVARGLAHAAGFSWGRAAAATEALYAGVAGGGRGP